jgi:hypothetical protein
LKKIEKIIVVNSPQDKFLTMNPNATSFNPESVPASVPKEVQPQRSGFTQQPQQSQQPFREPGMTEFVYNWGSESSQPAAQPSYGSVPPLSVRSTELQQQNAKLQAQLEEQRQQFTEMQKLLAAMQASQVSQQAPPAPAPSERKPSKVPAPSERKPSKVPAPNGGYAPPDVLPPATAGHPSPSKLPAVPSKGSLPPKTSSVKPDALAVKEYSSSLTRASFDLVNESPASSSTTVHYNGPVYMVCGDFHHGVSLEDVARLMDHSARNKK